MKTKGQMDFNVIPLIFAIIGGLFAVVISASMMNGILIKILVFVCTAAACYIMTDRIFQ